MKGKWHRRIRRLWWLPVIVGLGYLGYVWFNNTGKAYASQEFTNIINRTLSDQYRIQYNQLEVNLWEKKLTVTDLHFMPDSIPVEAPPGKMYQIRIPQFDIQLKSIVPIYRNKELIIDGLTIIDPEITVMDYAPKENPTVTSESINLFELLSQYLRLFKIGNLQIQQAEFAYWKKQEVLKEILALEDIDFNLQQFALDSTFAKHSFFNAETVEIIINEQKLLLPDEIHQLTFDRFRLSTQDSTVAFSHVHLSPRDSSFFADPAILAAHNLYNIKVPALQVNGIDFQSSYVNRDLRIDEVLFKTPAIFIQRRQGPPKSSKSTDNALTDLINQLTSSLQIEHILLDRGNARIATAHGQDDLLRFDINYLHLFDFAMDSLGFHFDRDRPPVQHFECNLKNLYHKSNKQRYDFVASDLLLNTQTGELVGQNLKLHPLHATAHPQQTKLSLHIPAIRLTRGNFMDALFTQNLELDQILIERPEAKFFLPKIKKDSAERTISTKPVQSFFAHFLFKELECRHLAINEGALEMDTTFNVKQYDFETHDLKLDTSVRSWKMLLNPFTLQFRQTNLKLPNQHVQWDTLNTDGQDHQLQAVYLQNDQGKFKIGELNLLNSDLDSLMHGQFAFDSILVDRAFAKIVANNAPNSKSSELDFRQKLPFTAPVVLLKDGRLDLTMPEGDHLKIDSIQSQWQADSLLVLQNIALKNAVFSPTGFHHQLTFEELIQTDTTDSYEILNLHLSPLDSTQRLAFPTQIPKLQLIGLDRARLLADQTFSFKKIALEHPSLHLTHCQDSLQQPTKAEDYPLFKVDTFVLKKGDFQLDFVTPTDTSRLHLPNIDLHFQHLNTSAFDQTIASIPKLYRSLSYQNNNWLRFENGKYAVQVLEPHFSAPSGDLMLPQIHFRDKKSQVHSTLNHVRIKGFALPLLLEKNQIHLDTCIIPKATLEVPLPEPADTNQTSELPKYAVIGVDPILIGHLQLDTLGLTLIEKDTQEIENIRLLADGLRLDSVLELNKLDQHYQRLAFDVPKINLTIGNYEEYDYTQSLHYSSRKEQLLAKDIRLEPKYDRQAYSQVVAHQTDHFDVSLDSIVFRQFALSDLFQESLHLKNVEIHQVHADIYRDRNVPRLHQKTPLVQSQIKAIPYPFLIDSLYLTGDFIVTELPADRTEPTVVSFDHIEGTLSPITNMASHLDTPMILQATGKLYDAGDFSTFVNFNMNDSLDAFTMSGVVHRMKIKPFNALLIPGARIHVKSGQNKELTFNMSANDNHAIGEMIFRYNKLKFLIATKEDVNKVNFGNSILSFWANRLVKSKNPSFLRKRIGVIYFERDQDKAIFNFWAKALLSGVVSSVGVKNNKKKLKHLGEENLKRLHYHELFSDPWKIKNKR